MTAQVQTSVSPTPPLSNLQLHLLKLFASGVSEEDLKAIQRMIARYFADKASDAEIGAFMRAVRKVAVLKGVDASGYRLIANTGVDGGQEVPHFHVHVLGGRSVGPMTSAT